jgi:hypothetical protein
MRSEGDGFVLCRPCEKTSQGWGTPGVHAVRDEKQMQILRDAYPTTRGSPDGPQAASLGMTQ